MRSILFRLFIAFTFFAFAGLATSCQRSACYVSPKAAKQKRSHYNNQYK